MTAIRTQVEDAVITALAPLLQTAVNGYLTSVQAYNGPIPPDEDDAPLARLLENGTPVAAVTAAGDVEYDAEKISLTHVNGQGDGVLAVMVVSGNPRSHEAHLRGDDIDEDPGLYQIEEDIRDLVWGSALDVSGVDVLNPTGTNTVRINERFTAFVLTFSMPMRVAAPEWDADADTYETIRSNINNADDDTIDPVLVNDTDIS